MAKMRYPKTLYLEIESLEQKGIVFQAENFILIQFFGSEENEPFGFLELLGDELYVGRDT
ncbi:hypothetical protein GL2_32830 [Microbulbifer sp. GL-2]|nr:hypothetical protein GL2_32830 [Microbulbifer sp. GL-2]